MEPNQLPQLPTEKVFVNYQLPVVDDVRKAIWSAMAQLMGRCGDVDETYQCAVVPTNPVSHFGSGGKLVDYVQTNNYQNDDWLANISPGSTTLMAVRIKPKAAVLAIAGFAIETDPAFKSSLPIARINIYRDIAMQKIVATATSYLSLTHMDYPLAYFLLPSPIIVRGQSELAIQVVSDARLSAPTSYVVMMLPPVVLVSRKMTQYQS
jgi:hypothetical protein